MAKSALCLLVISLLLTGCTGTQTAPQNPFTGPITTACDGLTGVLKQTARSLCKEKDSLLKGRNPPWELTITFPNKPLCRVLFPLFLLSENVTQKYAL